jgi:hypothetical protein
LFFFYLIINNNLFKKSQSMKKFVTDFDMFGHTIHLNFARQGENRNTILGGIFSMFIKFALSAYVII